MTHAGIPVRLGASNYATDPLRFCVGKVRYQSYLTASRAAWGLARALEERGEDVLAVSTYQCGCCYGIHVGTEGGDAGGRDQRIQARTTDPDTTHTEPDTTPAAPAPQRKAARPGTNGVDPRGTRHGMSKRQYKRDLAARVGRWLDDGGAVTWMDDTR